MANETSTGSVQHASFSQLRYFIKGCTLEGKSGSKDLVKTAVILLKTLPATRFAVLENFSSIYDDKVYNLLSSNEDSLDSSQYEIIDDIQDSLLSFVQQNPSGWTPIISAWAIDLLGQISSKYTNKYLQRKNLGQSASLNEILQMWMGCKATKSLIEISSECIATMVGDTPDSCVDALLETSVKHSPHFDWVVAHIGSCFPSTIINRVLMCGLKDFCMHGGIQAESGMVSDDNMPKFASVVGILGHLASQHSREIKLALMTLFQSSLEDDGCELYHQGVPYILRLASSSPMILKVITTDFIQTLTIPVLNRLADLSVHWYEKGEEDNDGLLHLLVHLVMNSEYGAYKILQLLLEMAFPQNDKDAMDTNTSNTQSQPAIKPAVKRTAKQVLQLVCNDLVKVVKNQGVPAAGSSHNFTADILLLKGLQGHVSGITRMMSASQGERLEWLYQIVKCLAFSSGEGQASKILCDILMYSKSTQHIPFFLDLQEELQIKLPSILEQTLENLLQMIQTTSKEERKVQALKSLLSIVKWENKKGESAKITRCTFTATLESHLETLTTLLCDRNNTVASTSLLILNYTRLPKMLPVFSVVTMCNAVVAYLFRLLKAIDQDKVEMCSACKQCILRLCNYPAGQKTLLRLLLETVLSKECGPCVGAREIVSISAPSTTVEMETDSSTHTVGLLESNRSLAGIPSRVSHGGIIGQGLRVNKKKTVLSQGQIYQNKPLFLNILWSVAAHGNLVTKSDNSMDTSTSSSTSKDDLTLNVPIARFIALLLIEYVTPDVMYNGIPWTEEEFMKVTIERDLLMKKTFDENPILWDIFDFLSAAPGAMCYCSAILRGIMATLLYHWDSCRDSKATNSPKQYEATCRIIKYMRKGNFLPPPLSYCGELLPYLSPYEVFLVLSNIWKYMKENPPVPEERNWTEIGIDRKYLDTIRPIFLSKIDQLGYLYGRFFSVKSST